MLLLFFHAVVFITIFAWVAHYPSLWKRKNNQTENKLFHLSSSLEILHKKKTTLFRVKAHTNAYNWDSGLFAIAFDFRLNFFYLLEFRVELKYFYWLWGPASVVCVRKKLSSFTTKTLHFINYTLLSLLYVFVYVVFVRRCIL